MKAGWVQLLGRLSLFLALASFPAVAQSLENIAGIHPADMRNLLKQLQQAVGTNNLNSIGPLIAYPAIVKVSGKTLHLKTAADFNANAPAIVTDKVRQAILGQKFDDLFVNSKGAMLGNGEIWVAAVCRDKACRQSSLKVIAFNPL